MRNVQVAVIGNGPAGSTVALMLAKYGISVVLIGKENQSFIKVGENLPPEAKPLLVFLGLWNNFLSDSHLPSYSNRSSWGNPNITYKDFIFK